MYNETMGLTKHVARTSILAKELFVALQSIGQADQELRASLKPSHLVALFGLQTLGHLLDGQLAQSIPIDLKLVALVARKDAL